MKLDNFKEWLPAAADSVGAYSAACIRMDNPLLKQRIAENNALVSDWLKTGARSTGRRRRP